MQEGGKSAQGVARTRYCECTYERPGKRPCKGLVVVLEKKRGWVRGERLHV